MTETNRPGHAPEGADLDAANRQNFDELDEPGADQLGENEIDPRGHLEPGIGPRDESGALLDHDERDTP